MGAARTSNAREVNCMRKVIGFDSYNLCPTGDVSKTLQAERADNEHLAMVFIGEEDESKSIWVRSGSIERCGSVVSVGDIEDTL